MPRPLHIAVLLWLTATAPALAEDCPANFGAGGASNADIVHRFYDMAFNDRQVDRAADCFLGETYIQHNPYVADGRDGFVSGLSGFLARHPELTTEIRRTISEDDLVVVHVFFRHHPEDRGSAVIDIFRLEDGRIVEHWDVVQAIPAQSANPNSMF
ncbi:nuclear transport factor 2 family protein [Maricaulis sp. CAU 1757]